MERRLYRNKKEKMLGGVAVGIGRYFDIDPVLIRICFIILVFKAGIGLIAYVILWIVVPVAPVEVALSGTSETLDVPLGDAAVDDEERERTMTARRERRKLFAGIGCIVFGLLFLAENLIPGFDLFDLWPIALIALGAGILWNAQRPSMPQEETR